MCFFAAIVVMLGGFSAGAAPDGGAATTKPSPAPEAKKTESDSSKKPNATPTKVTKPVPRKTAAVPPVPGKTKQPAKPKASKNKFVASEKSAEALRYQNLWIAYAAVWLIIFLFVIRTWKMNQGTVVEIDALKRRLAKLENRDDA